MKQIKDLLETINTLKVAPKHRTTLFYMGMIYLLIQGTALLVLANQVDTVVAKVVDLIP